MPTPSSLERACSSSRYQTLAGWRTEYSRRNGAARRRTQADHRHQRHDAGSAGAELDGLDLVVAPHGPSPDQAAQLHAIAGHEILHQVRRNLAVRKTLDRELDAPVCAWRWREETFA